MISADSSEARKFLGLLSEFDFPCLLPPSPRARRFGGTQNSVFECDHPKGAFFYYVINWGGWVPQADYHAFMIISNRGGWVPEVKYHVIKSSSYPAEGGKKLQW